MTIGFRILTRARKVDAATIKRFRTLPVANVSDSMSRMFAAGPRLRAMHCGGGMAGPALTVKVRPGDNLMIHKALDIAAKGDIVVVDGGGDLTNALIGELMSAHALKRGIGGIVINGAIRDSGAIRAGRLPVYAAGVTHRGPYKDGPGEINVTVALDGMVIEPGDLILGDDDGVVCVPYDLCAEVFTAASAKHKAEDQQMLEIRAGRSNRAWVDVSLKKLGCEGL